jgi:hypothetical protein
LEEERRFDSIPYSRNEQEISPLKPLAVGEKS